MAQKANKEGDVRFTIIASEQLIEDFKFISAWEKKKLKDLTNEVIGGFISEWKAKNKSVKFPPKS